MTTLNSIKNRVDALVPQEAPAPTNPRQMTDKQLMTAIVREHYGRLPTPEELTPEGSHRLIEIILGEMDE